jgi:protein TonB
MKLLLIIICLSSTIIVYSQQDSIVTYYSNGTIESIIHTINGVREGPAFFFYPNGNLKEERNYLNDKVNGLVKIYYPNGNLSELFNIENGRREGPASYFDSSGNHLQDVFFSEGFRKDQEYVLVGEYRQEDYLKLLEEWKRRQEERNKKTDEMPPEQVEEKNFDDDPAYFLNAEVMPEPIGGMATIYRKLTYPEEAKKKKIEGTVKVLAFIEKDGEVSNASVVEGIGYGCDEVARLAVYYTRFKPGMMKGKRVKVQMVIPVEFKLNR